MGTGAKAGLAGALAAVVVAGAGAKGAATGAVASAKVGAAGAGVVAGAVAEVGGLRLWLALCQRLGELWFGLVPRQVLDCGRGWGWC